MNTRLRIRNVVMVPIGTIALLNKSWFSDSIGDLAYAYLGNLAASFAIYFVVAIAVHPRLHRIWTAVVTLVIVEVFELTNGFGVMTDVFDPFDYLANGIGILRRSRFNPYDAIQSTKESICGELSKTSPSGQFLRSRCQ
jgi:hypothetical protein